MLALQSAVCQYAQNGKLREVRNESFVLNSSPSYFALSVLHLHYPRKFSVTLTPTNISQLFRNLQRICGSPSSQWSSPISGV